jgi:hypothetical protein
MVDLEQKGISPDYPKDRTGFTGHLPWYLICILPMAVGLSVLGWQQRGLTGLLAGPIAALVLLVMVFVAVYWVRLDRTSANIVAIASSIYLAVWLFSTWLSGGWGHFLWKWLPILVILSLFGCWAEIANRRRATGGT